MFVPRLLSGIVMVILAIVLIICGGNVLLFSTLFISLIGMFELYRVLQIEKTPLAICSYLITALFYCNLGFGWIADPFLLIMGLLILLMFVYVLAYPKYEAKHIMAAFFGMFYVGVMLSYVYQIRTLENGLYLAFLIFICSWGCDTCAYCVGMLIGKHKMSPILSPKKSVEGAVGGVLGTALLTVIYCLIFGGQMEMDLNGIIILTVIAAVAGLISMVGDLCASAIKRNYDIKDYGKLIPGHGGIMDRFDSMMITAPIIYYLAILFMQVQ
ncbi:MAG: phosphatidate cytidylyltransferase [Lachnospiraceae bacterium]|nr:phosphatidate cytidylyltransferase [Lachnospiraceae bacterium]